MAMLSAVNAKTYKRTDGVPGSRLGMVAQDVQAACPPEWGNLVQMHYGDAPLQALSYDRLTCVLWSCCQSMQARIEALETKLAANTARPASARGRRTT